MVTLQFSYNENTYNSKIKLIEKIDLEKVNLKIDFLVLRNHRHAIIKKLSPFCESSRIGSVFLLFISLHFWWANIEPYHGAELL